MDNNLLNRNVEILLINNLKEESLYTKYLKKDIESGDIFVGFRKNEISFYYKNQRLFVYTKEGFLTHVKYALTKGSVGNKDYFLEQKLKEKELVIDFIKNYEEMKTLAGKYATVEGDGVAKLYKHNFFKWNENNFFLLDIEIALKGASKSRIDYVLYNKKDKSIQFFEAKHFSNPELWAKKETKPKVVEQVEKYKVLIKEHKKCLIKEYAVYLKQIKELFELEGEFEVKTCKNTVPLFMFGFNKILINNSKQLLEESLNSIDYYFIGDSSGVEQNSIAVNMWKD